jgi:hypothetical protein
MKQGIMVKRLLASGIREERPKNIKGELAAEHKSIKEHVTNLLSGTARTILNARAIQFQGQLQKSHRLGNWLGKFHPSKSRKGIKRSE